MKKILNGLNLRKSIAMLLVFASLLLVSCNSGDSSSTSMNESLVESTVSEYVTGSSEAPDEASSGEVSDATSSNEETSEESIGSSDDLSAELSSDTTEETSDAVSDVTSEASKEETSKEETSKEETSQSPNTQSGVGDKVASAADLNKIPEYSGKDYIVINGGIPYFTAAQLTTAGYEKYGELDSLGRCTAAIASLGEETMPTDKRGSISSVKPTGWVQAQYSCIKTKDLYNRSHLIAWSLAGENANKQNLVTGTAHLNQEVMTQFEDMVLDYLKETGNHVAYRITPLFKGNELVCRGIQMEAYSVEDNGEGICFNVYCYNVQEGVVIDYATGNSYSESGEESSEESSESSKDDTTTVEADYVLNKSSKKIHLPECDSVNQMSEKNKVFYTGTIEDLLAQGYKGCGNCLNGVS